MNAVIQRVFIGSVSPSGHMLQMLTGAFKLTCAAREAGAETVIYDTSGLIDPSHGGINLKLAKIELLRPNVIFAIQANQELDVLLTPLKINDSRLIRELRPSPGVWPRDTSVRKRHRQERFAAYFAHSEKRRLDLKNTAFLPGPELEPTRLTGLEDEEGFMRSLGIVQHVSRTESELQLLTPPPLNRKIKVLRPGSVLVDPRTFEDRFNL